MYFLLEKTVDFPLNYVSYTLQAVEDLEREEVGDEWRSSSRIHHGFQGIIMLGFRGVYSLQWETYAIHFLIDELWKKTFATLQGFSPWNLVFPWKRA